MSAFFVIEGKPKEWDNFLDSSIDKDITDEKGIEKQIVKDFSKEYETTVVKNFGNFASTNAPKSQKELAEKLVK